MKKRTRKRRGSSWSAVALVVASTLVLPGETQSEDAAALAAALAKIRQEVEALSAEVGSKRDDMKNRLRSLASQKAELEMERGREEMRLKQLKIAKAKRVEEVVDDTHRDALLEPVVMRSADIIENNIRDGLPFKTEERLVAVESIRRKRKEGLLRSADAVARLWDRVEDELRLAGENGIYRQVVAVGGEEMLADVARLGMVMLYYKTKDGRIGKAVQSDGRWGYEPITEPEGKKQVVHLFDAFKKQIRAGFFLLPEALPKKGGSR